MSEKMMSNKNQDTIALERERQRENKRRVQ
jgi:hypothetical protein